MLLIVFGAGASYDSVPSLPPREHLSQDRPPLADELFATRPEFKRMMARFPRIQPIIPYLQASGSSVERELERLQTEAEGYPEGGSQLAAVRYYLHYMLWELEARWSNVAQGVTNYKTLLDQIQRWQHPKKVCLATFNYDRMLEDALPSVGIKIQNLTDYIGSEHFKLIKLHGSVNWTREIYNIPLVLTQDPLMAANQVIELAPKLPISTDYRIVTLPLQTKLGGALFPALAIPVEKKSSFECPEQHLDALRQYVKQVSKLLIIGWRGMEEHFLNLLRENLSGSISVMLVNGKADDAKHTLARLQKAEIELDPVPADPLKVGFSDFIVQRIGESFLKK
jgi:SIR2-like domain